MNALIYPRTLSLPLHNNLLSKYASNLQILFSLSFTLFSFVGTIWIVSCCFFFRVFTSISLKKIKRKSFIFSELILCNDRFDQQGWCKEHGFRTHTTTLLQSTSAGKRRNPIVSLGKRDYQREWIKRKTLNDWWIIYNGLCVIDGALMTRATKQTRTHAPWLHVHWFVCQIFICV